MNCLQGELLPQHLDAIVALVTILIDALRHYGIGYRRELLLHLMEQVHNTNVGAMAARLGRAWLWLLQQLQAVLIAAPAAPWMALVLRWWLLVVLVLSLKVLIDGLGYVVVSLADCLDLRLGVAAIQLVRV